MVQKANVKGKAPPPGLTIRTKASGSPGASHTQRDGTAMTQEARLASNNETGRGANDHARVTDRQTPSSAHTFQAQISVVAEGSTSTTNAVGSDTPRRSSDTDSIELGPDPEHPHARHMQESLQEFQKPFDGKDENSNGHGNGQA
jgi:hypothetical protein